MKLIEHHNKSPYDWKVKMQDLKERVFVGEHFLIDSCARAVAGSPALRNFQMLREL